MKYFFALLSGFFLTLFVFGSGAVVAIMYLAAEPVPVRSPQAARSPEANASAFRSEEPVRVVASQENVTRFRTERPEKATGLQALSDLRPPERNTEPATDPTTTGATSPERDAVGEKFRAAHLAWCSERYRSYDPVDNSYNAYSGARRECISPFSDAIGSPASSDEATSPITASADGPSAFAGAPDHSQLPNPRLSPEHIRSCFERYRSYRPEDNTYQPYGGGPRQQCE